jgi:hypothetical protein
LKPWSPFRDRETRVILTAPGGRPFTQAVAGELASLEHVILICGSYEGFDERIREHLADDALSIGDYVLTNGSAARDGHRGCRDPTAFPGALGDASSAVEESHGDWVAGIPAVHPARRLSGMAGAGGADVGQPCRDRPMASEAIPEIDGRTSSGPVGKVPLAKSRRMMEALRVAATVAVIFCRKRVFEH